MATAPNMSPQELERVVRSLESSIDELSPPPAQGVLASVNGHVRRYLPFYALLTAWLLIVALIPLVDRGESAPVAAQAGGPAGAAAGSPTGTTAGTPGGQAGTFSGAGAGVGSAGELPDPTVRPADVDGDQPDEDEGAGEGEFVDVPEVEEDVLEQLAPVIQALGQFYDEATPVWEQGNEVIGLLTPVLVDLAIALSPAMTVLAQIGGGDLRAVCENLGLAGTVFGVVQPAGLLPPLDFLSFMLPLFLLCGDVFDEVDEDEPALVLDTLGV